MSDLPEIRDVVQALTATISNKAELAKLLGVSPATVGRWERGMSVPHPNHEGAIRALLQKEKSVKPQLQFQHTSFHSVDTEDTIRTAVYNTLTSVRELLHRSGGLSSRHECLDEISKLLFAHIMSIDSGGDGITSELLSAESDPQRALVLFVDTAFKRYLPSSLSHEIGPDAFRLKLRSAEKNFTVDLIRCFETNANAELFRKLDRAGELDLINDVFGQFLADSFIDEKELGQYLTPVEVVRFMVQLGLTSLSSRHLSGITDLHGSNDPFVILDPSCGVGTFLAEAVRVLGQQLSSSLSDEQRRAWLDTMLRSNLVGIDKSERMIRLALTNLALFGMPTANLHLANSLVRSGPDAAITDSLEGRACLILTNPPFGAEFPAPYLAGFKVASKWATRTPTSAPSEILFMERYLDWLSPDGVLVAVVPDSVLTNRGLFQDLRDGLRQSVEVLSVISLPKVTFGVAGTNTKTSILHLRKLSNRSAATNKTYFAICNDIGYEVSARGSQRRKLKNGKNELLDLLPEATGGSPVSLGQKQPPCTNETRWDATYHAGMPNHITAYLRDSKKIKTRVGDIAILASDRLDPRRLGSGSFRYIEISDVDGATQLVLAKAVQCSAAPSRARKVVRAGDVLVSTVRPERRTIGVVPPDLDGAICSTGFAVLRPSAVDGHVLARLLQSDIANVQILRNNIGIAYPAIQEDCLLDIFLPVSIACLKAASELAVKLEAAYRDLTAIQLKFCAEIKRLTDFSEY